MFDIPHASQERMNNIGETYLFVIPPLQYLCVV